jgi:3'(2'), 5'-bisphosphate nucleotidase
MANSMSTLNAKEKKCSPPQSPRTPSPNTSVLGHIIHRLRDFKHLIQECNEVIMKNRQPGMKIEWKVDKKGRKSPTTDADIEVNTRICAFLEGVNTHLALDGYKMVIVAEENEEEASKHRFDDDVDGVWLVDGLDGTSDYIDFENGGEGFTCGNIGLVQRLRNDDGTQSTEWSPVFGMFSTPSDGTIYWGHKLIGSFKESLHGEQEQLVIPNIGYRKVFGREGSDYRVAVSGKHCNSATEEFLERVFPHGAERIAGGSSRKVTMVTEGEVDMYPRLGPTMEWDICAAHAVHKYAGGLVVEYDEDVKSPYNLKELTYNKSSLYNPFFIVI